MSADGTSADRDRMSGDLGGTPGDIGGMSADRDRMSGDLGGTPGDIGGMSADPGGISAGLGGMFAALKADAEAVPLPEVAAARGRGERRRRVRRGTVLATVACLVAGMTVGVTWAVRGGSPPPPADKVTPSPARPVTFMPLKPVGGDGVKFGAVPPRFAMSAVIGDRAWAGWLDENGALKVGGMDLTNGKAVGGVRTLGHYGDWNGLVAVPQALLVLGEHDDGAHNPDYTMFVLDPVDGTVRWQREYNLNGEDFLPYDTGLVLADRETGLTRELDWRTGAVKWTTTAGRLRDTSAMRAVADPAPVGSFSVRPVADRRFVQVTEDGTARVLDADTGTVQSARPGVGSGRPVLSADNVLYLLDDQRPAHLTAYDLGSAGQGRTIYTAGDGQRRVNDVQVCGTGRVCLVEETDRKGSDVVMLDTATGRQVWRKPAPANSQIIPGTNDPPPMSYRISAAGDRILLAAERGGQAAGLFDPSGGQLLIKPEARASVGWITGASLLALELVGDMAMDHPTSPRPAEVIGISARDGTRTILGRLPAAAGLGCSWNDRYLVCQTATGFEGWRFAAD